MEYIKINYEELSALNGLPHLQQLLYLRGIKPFVDYRTGIVGLMRGISYQSLAEELYIEPHSGIKSGSPSKDQIRRAIKGLEKAGLLRIQSLEWTLVFQCLLVNEHNSNRNKAALKQNEHSATITPQDNPLTQGAIDDSNQKQAKAENDQPAIPQSNNNFYFIFLLQQFEKFWEHYPLKKSKQKTWEQFQALQPTDELMQRIFAALETQATAYAQLQAQGQWVPGWKFPANWLAQHCWDDEINLDTIMENNRANRQASYATSQSVDPFWDSCKGGAEFVAADSNIVDIGGFRKTEKTH